MVDIHQVFDNTVPRQRLRPVHGLTRGAALCFLSCGMRETSPHM